MFSLEWNLSLEMGEEVNFFRSSIDERHFHGAATFLADHCYGLVAPVFYEAYYCELWWD